MTALFELQGASISAPGGELLRSLDWAVRREAVTAVVGPAGTGKSALLRALSGRTPPSGWHIEGIWRFLGEGVERSARGLSPHVAWVPQPGRGDVPARQAHAACREALASSCSTLLLDEPTRGLTASAALELAETLRARAPRGGIVLVTHDLAFARRVAHDVALVCAGRLAACGPAPAFFESPPNELAAGFVRQGNCWPPPVWPPPLPAHFRWVLPERLAGMGRPGLLGDVDADLEAVAASGVTLLVSLTEEPLPADKLRSFGLQARHFPIVDMGVPAISPTASLCREIERAMAEGAVALHCRAGMGRTGTLLASVLVWLGDAPEAAVSKVREVARGYIQNAVQLDFVRRFAAAVGRPPE
jgi:atypical dual specificity phosphatase